MLVLIMVVTIAVTIDSVIHAGIFAWRRLFGIALDAILITIDLAA